MVTPMRSVLLGLLAALPFACKPDFDDRASEIANIRVLAVQAEPAEWSRTLDPDTGEARPAKFRALVVTASGTIGDANLEWAFCMRPRPLNELNDVSIACFQNDPSFIVPIGSGAEASAAVPENTCRQFGPDIPEDQSFRPADPDVTGGYYQPLRVLYRPTPDSLVPTIGKVRIRCGLPGASQEQTQQYNRSYHLNANPVIAAVTANLPTGPVLLGAADAAPKPAPLPVAPGQKVSLTVSWPACPLVDVCGDGVCGPTETKEPGPGSCDADCRTGGEKACGGAERFLAFSLETRTLSEVREIMRVSWYAPIGAGSFRDDRTGRDGNDLVTDSENELTAPTTPGVHPVWVVLRDSRGGMTWRTVEVDVR
ncbi:MAG: hypothetical protein JWP97_4236 [Labilithrix sp.]|nr:hypothetical protein [Labilithrix sp.]